MHSTILVYTIALCTHDVHLPMQAENNNKVVVYSYCSWTHRKSVSFHVASVFHWKVQFRAQRVCVRHI